MMRGLMLCGLTLAAYGSDVQTGLCDNKEKCCMHMRQVIKPKDTGALSGARQPQTQVADLGFGLNELYPGNRVWQDLTESAWKSVPPWVVGTDMLVPSSVITGTNQMFWQCAAEQWTGQPHCEIYAFAYGCLACDFEKGDFQQLMADEGFEAFRCSPTVNSRTGGGEHHMIGYVKVIDAGTSYTLEINAPVTEFVTFGMEPKPMLCSNKGLQDCELSQKCEWNSVDGTCGLRHCNDRPVGPLTLNPPCTKLCIKDDL